MPSRSVQDYLQAIYYFNEKGLPARNSEIASRINVSPPSVTEMLKKLEKEDYLTYTPYRGVFLTEKGWSAAERIVRKHRLLERFLTDILGLNREKVHEQACKLEHGLTNEAEEALCRVLDHPDTSPDDSRVIPPCSKDVSSCLECTDNMSGRRRIRRGRELVPLTSLKIGEEGVITFIRAGRAAVQRLMDMGLTQGTSVKILTTALFSGPLEIMVRGAKLAIGWGLANRVFVKPATL